MLQWSAKRSVRQVTGQGGGEGNGLKVGRAGDPLAPCRFAFTASAARDKG